VVLVPSVVEVVVVVVATVVVVAVLTALPQPVKRLKLIIKPARTMRAISMNKFLFDMITSQNYNIKSEI